MLRITIVSALLACAFGYSLKPSPRLLDHRIVGGEEVDITDFPHQVSLRVYGSHSCGGSIISSNWVLTASHCISDLSESTDISVGSTDRHTGTAYKIKRVVNHPQYDNWNIDFDYALLEIDGEIEFGPGVQPIKLAEQELEDGQLVNITGWGKTDSFGELTSNLMKVSVPIVSRDKCGDAYSAFFAVITENMICAGLTEGGKDSCQGDSGGPLVANETLYGVVSWGFGCAQPDFPGVYSNVAAARPWIKEVSGV